MARLNLRRTCTWLVSEVVPTALTRIPFGRFRYKLSQPKGQQRPDHTNFSLSVPFHYAIASKPRNVAVVCHLFHADLSSWLLEALERSGLTADLFISTDTPQKAESIGKVLSLWQGGTICIRVVENRGRDIAPKLITFADVYQRYEFLLFLHSKKSLHYDFGDRWRDYLTRALAGSPAVVNSIMEIFDRCPKVGLIVPQHFGPLRAATKIEWGKNFRIARRLAWRMDIDLRTKGYLDMPSGSMFWARPKVLRPLIDLHLNFQDFPLEPCAKDGTLAHSIERLFLFVSEKAGYGWVKVTDAVDDPTAVEIKNPSDIAAFMEHRGFHLLSSGGRHR